MRWYSRAVLSPMIVVAGAAITTSAVLSVVSLYFAIGASPALRFFDPRRSPTVDEAWVVSTMDYALASAEKNDVVFLGDSICRTGIEPAQFERLTHLRAYNLGLLFGGLGPTVLPNVARSYLSRHPAPRIVVLCASPVCFERDVPSPYLPIRDRFLNCYGFDVPNVGSLEGSLQYVASLAYNVRQGALITCDRIAWSLTGRRHDVRDDPLLEDEQQSYRSFEWIARKTRGYYALYGTGHEANIDRADGIVLVYDAWDRGVRSLAEACEDAHVPLLIRLGPISAEASKNLNFAHLERWLEDLRHSYPHLAIARDHNVLRYAPELCFDSTHLNVNGADKFTRQVADDVRAALGWSVDTRGR
jgi:hypothetical protein